MCALYWVNQGSLNGKQKSHTSTCSNWNQQNQGHANHHYAALLLSAVVDMKKRNFNYYWYHLKYTRKTKVPNHEIKDTQIKQCACIEITYRTKHSEVTVKQRNVHSVRISTQLQIPFAKTATLSKKLQTKSRARCLPETYSEKIGRTPFLEMHTIPEKAVHMRPGTRKPLREIQVDPTTGRPWTQHEILRVFNNCPPRQPSHFRRSKKYRTIVRHDLRSTSAIRIRNKQEIQIDTPWNPLATFFGRARNALEIAMSPMDN